MKNYKAMKVKSAKLLAKVVLEIGKMSVDSACFYICHQPEIPMILREMKRNK